MTLLLAICRMPDHWLPSETTAVQWMCRHDSTQRPFVVPLERTSGRFDHLDLDYYRQTMSARDFRFFVTFAGGDTLGFTEDDLEVFYPPEE